MPRGSCVTPGASRDRSVKRRPFRGKSLIDFSSITTETALGTVSTNWGAPDTVTVSFAPAHAQMELNFDRAPDFHVNLRRDLRRHALDLSAGGVVAGRKKFDGEAAVGIGDGRARRSGGGIDHRDGGRRDGPGVRIKNHAANRTG